MELNNLGNIKKRYIYNSNKNYLVIDVVDVVDSYKTHMVMENNIQGLLKMNCIRKNNEQQFMYEISSLQAVDKLFESTKLCYEEIRSIIKGICIVSDSIKKYFLNADNILIVPEMIYINLETYETQFVFNPYYSVSIWEQLRELSRYFIGKINYTDIEAVTCVYKFNEIVMRDNFVISDIIKSLEFENEKEKEKDSEGREDGYEYVEYIDETAQTKKQGILRKLVGGFKKRFYSCPELVCEKEDFEYKLEDSLEKNKELQEIGDTVLMQVIKDKKYCLCACNANYCDISINAGGVVIGKLEKNVDVVIKDPSVSRIHAKCETSGEKCYIEDLNTTNGTYINGRRLIPYKLEELREGDRVVFGCVEYIIKLC